MKRKILKAILICLAVVIALPTLLVILTQVPSIQTFAARKATQLLSESIDGQINLDKVYISFPNKLVLKDVSITSPTPIGNNDTLLNCRTLYLSIRPAEILKGNIGIGRLILEDGNFNLVTEAEGQSNLNRIFGKGDPDKKEKKDINLKFSADEVRLKNFGFDLINYRNKDKVKQKNPERTDIVNFSDLDVSDINVSIRDVEFRKDSLTAYIKQISAIDKSGFQLETLSGDFSMNEDGAAIRNMTLSDGHSTIISDLLSFDFSQEGSGQDFLNKVILTLDMKNSLFDFQTIARITPSLEDCHLKLLLNGKISGPISDLRAEHLIVNTGSGTCYLDIDAKVQGLPEVDETILIADINDASLTFADVAHIVAEFGNGVPSAFLMNLTPTIPYRLRAGITGLLLDFGVNASLQSVYGAVYPDLRVNVSGSKEEGVSISGRIRTDRLNSGMYTGIPMLGDLNMNGQVFMNFGNSGMNIKADRLSIENLDFNGNHLDNIHASGQYSQENAEIILTSRNKIIQAEVQGKADFRKKDSTSMQVNIDLGHLDLAKMGFNKNDSISVVKGKVNADIHTNSRYDVFGRIDIRKLYYINENRVFPFEDISYRSVKNSEGFDITLTSPFTDVSYKASAPLSSFARKIYKGFLHEALPSIFTRGINGTEKGNYDLQVKINNTEELFDIIRIPVKVSTGTQLNIAIDSTDQMKGYLSSDSLSFNGYRIHHLSGELGRDTSLTAHLLCRDISAGGFDMHNCNIEAVAHQDNIHLKYNFENKGEEQISSSANLSVNGNFVRPSKDAPLGITVRFDSSDIFFNSRLWEIPESSIRYSADSIVVENFVIRNMEQNLKVNGTLSKNPEDRLSLNMNKFDISIANMFMSRPMDLKGLFSGKAEISDLNDIPDILLDLTGEGISFYQKPVGNLYIASEWNEELKVFDISLLNTLQQRNRLNVNGYYSPDEKYLNLNTAIDSLSMALVEPFVPGLFTDMSGSLTGKIDLEYSKENGISILSDKMMLNDLGLTVDFIRVPYRINGPLRINNKEIYVDNAVLTDEFGRTGTVKGGITHDRLKDIRLNTHIDFKNLHCMNTRERDNSSFYGKVFATGKIDITGPLDDIVLDISATTEENTSFHVPLSSSSTASSSGLLKFVSRNDTLQRRFHLSGKDLEGAGEKSSNLAVSLDINATPNAEVMIEINKSTGDILKATGQGNIKINIDPSEDVFDMFGDYTIDQGSYKFVILGITSKDFILQQGGQINFDGDIMNSRLNASALYRTKASLNTLTADTSSVSSRRNVDCYINLTGILGDPQIGFDIKIPDLDPTTKSRVDGILSSEDKIQKQFVSLLVSGSFLPDEQSGIVNNSTLLYANVSEMISNQLNNVFRQLDIPIDLGLNYQPGEANNKGGDIFDVAISTQLFNNRVIVNGNIGNGQYDKANTVVGDIDIEIKLNKSGNLRLNIFSHSADQYSNYLDDSQRQGVGIIYQDEFNNFKELWRKIFWSKKRKEKYAKEQMERFMKDQTKKADRPEEK